MPDIDNRSNLNNGVDVSPDFDNLLKIRHKSSTKTRNETQYKDTDEMHVDLSLPPTSSGIQSSSKILTRCNKINIPKGKKVKSNINKESVIWENTTFQHKVDLTHQDLQIPEK